MLPSPSDRYKLLWRKMTKMGQDLFSLNQYTILLSITGSRAYGMARQGSDVDIKGVFIPPKEYLIGCFQRCEQINHPHQISTFLPLLSQELQHVITQKKLEGTVYTLQKFLRLAADGNPNMLELLFTRDEELIVCTAAGTKLREARHLFISTKVRHTFLGYAISQLKRIQTHRRWLTNPPKGEPSREVWGLPERREEVVVKLYNAIETKLNGWSWNFSQLTQSERLTLKGRLIDQLTEMGIAHTELWHVAARKFHSSDQLIERIRLERNYDQAKREWYHYQVWLRQRNPERALLEAQSGYDTKHAAHLVRLLRMGRELFTEGICKVWRGDYDAEELVSIRDGAWSYDQLIDWTEVAKKELQALDQTQSPLPLTADRQGIDTLCQSLIMDALCS